MVRWTLPCDFMTCLSRWYDHHGCPCRLTFSQWGCYGLCLRHKPTKLAHSFYSVFVSVSVFVALSAVFHFMNSPDNSPLSHSVLPVLVLSTIYLFMKVSLSPDIILCGWLGFKHQLTNHHGWLGVKFQVTTMLWSGLLTGRADDGGVYRCVASNSAGEDYTEMKLTVQSESKLFFFLLFLFSNSWYNIDWYSCVSGIIYCHINVAVIAQCTAVLLNYVMFQNIKGRKHWLLDVDLLIMTCFFMCNFSDHEFLGVCMHV